MSLNVFGKLGGVQALLENAVTCFGLGLLVAPCGAGQFQLSQSSIVGTPANVATAET